MTVLSPKTVYAPGREPPKAEVIQLLEGIITSLAAYSPIAYIFDTATADADPGAGKVRLNNADASLATIAYFDNDNQAGVTVSAILDSWDDSSSATKGYLQLTKSTDPSVFHSYTVTGTVVDGTGYRKVTISHVGGAGAFAADDVLLVQFLPKGDVGPASTLVDPNGPRIPVGYYSGTQVQITGVRSIAMGGFRYKGRYKVGRAPVFAMPAFTDAERHTIDLGNGTSTAGQLFSEAYHAKNCWYAQFVAASDGDGVATLGSMPFLRAGSVSGNVITLNASGINTRSISTKTHQFTANALVGCEVLVITETLSGRANAFSGRITTVTANTTTSITLADAGSIGAYDYFLVAPQKPGGGAFDHYAYLNACYIDAAEVRNIADTGTLVGTRGDENTMASINGALTGWNGPLYMDTHISPLATAAHLMHEDQVSTATDGDLIIRYGTDASNHGVVEEYYRKDSGTSASFRHDMGFIPFSFGPQLYFESAGALNIAATSRKIHMRGWIEP